MRSALALLCDAESQAADGKNAHPGALLPPARGLPAHLPQHSVLAPSSDDRFFRVDNQVVANHGSGAAAAFVLVRPDETPSSGSHRRRAHPRPPEPADDSQAAPGGLREIISQTTSSQAQPAGGAAHRDAPVPYVNDPMSAMGTGMSRSTKTFPHHTSHKTRTMSPSAYPKTTST